MVVKNLTNAQQKVRVIELTGDKSELNIYIQPSATVDIENRFKILKPELYKGILDFCGTTPASTPVVEKKEEKTPVEEEKTPVEEEKTPVVEDKVEESPVVEETPVAEVSEKAEDVAEEFKCEICGAVYASEAGLTRHMNKAHAE